MAVSRNLRRQVISRANHRCEYCHMPEAEDLAHFEIDHVRPLVHGGLSTLDSLAWACFRCNNRKATNLGGINPATQQLVRLFNPRLDDWSEHFVWHGGVLIGLTAEGQTTIEVLTINAPVRVAFRETLITEGLFH